MSAGRLTTKLLFVMLIASWSFQDRESRGRHTMTEENQTPYTAAGNDDTEGHIVRGTDDGDDTEGHIVRGTDDGDDTEGHIVRGTDDGDDTEGHIVRGTDDGDDTEGHMRAR
jgi:hypothetical protein